MAEEPPINRLVAARARANTELASRMWDSVRIALVSGGATLAATTASVAGLVSVPMLDKSVGWGIIFGSLLVGPVSYLALEFKRLSDRSEALKELYYNHADFELRISEITEDRDRHRATATELKHFNSALQATLLIISRPQLTSGDKESD